MSLKQTPKDICFSVPKLSHMQSSILSPFLYVGHYKRLSRRHSLKCLQYALSFSSPFHPAQRCVEFLLLFSCGWGMDDSNLAEGPPRKDRVDVGRILEATIRCVKDHFDWGSVSSVCQLSLQYRDLLRFPDDHKEQHD